MTEEAGVSWVKVGYANKMLDESGRSKTLTLDEGKLKEIATDFFRWWYNQSGTNTDQAFDEWMRLNRARLGL